MKKSYTLFVGLVLIAASLVFTGCENFLNSNNLKNDIEKKINYANSSTVSIVLKADNGFVSMDSLNKLKVTDSFNVTYTEGNSGYQFVKWIAEPSDAVSFDDVNDAQTKVTVEKFVDEIKIKPFCYERPIVLDKLPVNQPGGVEKNSTIYITFSKKLSDQNDLSRISVTMNDENLLSSDGIENVFKIPSLHDNVITILADRNHLLEIGSTEKIKVTIPGDFYYVSTDDYKISIGDDLVYEYVINNSTLEKAEIYFSATDGEITPNATRHFNIGETFDISYKAKDGYKFNSWSITAGLSNVTVVPDTIIKNKKYYYIDGDIVFEVTESSQADAVESEDDSVQKITVKVIKEIVGVSIKADAKVLPKVESFEPKYKVAGVDCDSPVEITFNTEINIESFRFSDNEIPSGAEKLLDLENRCYGYKSEDFVVFKNILFTDLSTGLDVTDCFSVPELSEDNKTLCITPLYDKLLIDKGSSLIKTIQISLNTDESIEDLTGVVVKGIYTNQYRINANREKQPPVVEEFYFASNSEKLQRLKNGDDVGLYDTDWHEWNDNDDAYYRNHVSKIHFYVKGTEANSQLYKVKVIETQYLTFADKKYTPVVLSIPQTYEKYAEGIFYSIDNEDCAWGGDFVYTPSSEKDGIEKLDFYLEDYNGNSTYINTYWINKDTEFVEGTGSVFTPSENYIWAIGYNSRYTKNNMAYEIHSHINDGYVYENGVKEMGSTLFWFVRKLTDTWYVPNGYRTQEYSYGYDFVYEVKWSIDKDELELDSCASSGRLKFEDCLAFYSAKKSGEYSDYSSFQFFYTIPDLDESKDYYFKIVAYDQADNPYSVYGIKLKAPELVKGEFDGDILNIAITPSDNLLPGYTQKYAVYYSKNYYSDEPVFNKAELENTADDYYNASETTFSVKIPYDNFYKDQDKVEFFVKSVVEYDATAYEQELGGYKQSYSGQLKKYSVKKDEVFVTDSSMSLPDFSTTFVSKGSGTGKYELILSVDENSFDNMYIQADKEKIGDQQYFGFTKGENILKCVVDVDVLYNQEYTIKLTGEKNGKIKTGEPVVIDTSNILYNKRPDLNADYFTVDGFGDYLILNAPVSKAEIEDDAMVCYYCTYKYPDDLYNSQAHANANYAKKLTEQGILTSERIRTFNRLPVYYYSDSDKTKIKIPVRTLPNEDYVICVEVTDIFGNTNCSSLVYFNKSEFDGTVSLDITNTSIEIKRSSNIHYTNASLQVYDSDNKKWNNVFENVPVYSGYGKTDEKQKLLYSDIPSEKGSKPDSTKTAGSYNKFYKMYYHSNSENATSYYWNSRLYHPDSDKYGALLNNSDESGELSCSLSEQTVKPYYFYASGSSFTTTECSDKELREGLGALFEYYAETKNGNIKESDVILYVDQPVLVQTLVSDTNWSEEGATDNLNAVLWDQHVLEENVKNTQVLTPQSKGTANKILYNVNTSEISAGKYYVIVAHFADGTSAVSEVRIR